MVPAACWLGGGAGESKRDDKETDGEEKHDGRSVWLNERCQSVTTSLRPTGR